jgi:hypothetical protein
VRLTRSCFALGLVLAVHAVASSGCKDSASSTEPAGGTPSGAEVRWPDAGPAELSVSGRVVALPPGELAAAAHPPVMQDEKHERFAFLRGNGDVRLVFLIAGNAYLGPVVKAPLDFRAAPDREHALGELYEIAADRRAQLVADVGKQLGPTGVARMLLDGAGVEDPTWDEAFAKLPEASVAVVKSGLASELEPGKPTSGLKRAVKLLPLREPVRARLLAARLRELADTIKEPRASAVMLRALAAIDKQEGATVGCEVLGKKPLDVANAKGTAAEIDTPGRELLVEAALLGIANAGAECPQVAAQMGEDVCVPSFRCNDAGPLTGREPTKQDEPVCTSEQLADAIAKDLARGPADVLAGTGGPRPQLFAFAALAKTGKVPESITRAHARRRYALAQPKDPVCDNTVAPGTPCHCEEAILRDQACRNPVSKVVSVGVCKFEIDDKTKKISNVVATPPP